MSNQARAMSDHRVAILIRSEDSHLTPVEQDVPLTVLLEFSKEARRQLQTATGKLRSPGKQQLVLRGKTATPFAVSYIISAMRHAYDTKTPLFLKEVKSLPFYKTLEIHLAALTLDIDALSSNLALDIHEHIRKNPVTVIEMKTLWERFHIDSNISKTFLYNTERFVRNGNVLMDRDAIESYLDQHPELQERLEETRQNVLRGNMAGVVGQGPRHFNAQGRA